MTLTDFIRRHRPVKMSSFAATSGLNWYATVTPTKGADLREGDWLDSVDHSGARQIVAASGCDSDGVGAVMFFGGDSETVLAGVEYPVVDPKSQVAPDRVRRRKSVSVLGQEGKS